MTEQSGTGNTEPNPGEGYGQQPPPYPGQQPPPPPQQGGGYPPPPPSYGGQPAQPTSYPTQGGYPAQGTYPPAPAYPGAAGYPAYPGQEPVKKGYSGFAIASFITGLIIPVVGFLVAIPLGIVALVKIKRHGYKGRWMAIVGIVLSLLWLGGAIAVGVWFNSTAAERNSEGVITSAGRLDFGDIRTGDCVKISGLDSGAEIGLFDITGVPCADPHNAQSVYVVTFDEGRDYPGATAIGRLAQTACAPHYAPFQGQDLSTYTLYPTESRWDQDNGHRAICFVTKGADSTMTGSVLK